MNNEEFANQVAQQVLANTQFWISIVGVVGGIVGAGLTVGGQFLRDRLRDGPQRRLDDARKKHLKRMLEDERFPDKWRRIATLSRVIGADEETTKRLLLEVGARGSEKDDGLWGLCVFHPFSETDKGSSTDAPMR